MCVRVCVHECVKFVCVFVGWNENKWDHYLGRGAEAEWARGNTVIILLFDDAETMLICFISQSDAAVPVKY